jgi:branched-chain amino acid transport system permease protein
MLVALAQAIVSGLAVGGAYALVALGFSITFTTTKTLNFSQGDFVSVGAFVGITVLWLLLGKPLNSPLADATVSVWQQLAAALAAVVVIGLLGVLLYALAVRPFAGKGGMSWVMSTIGFGIILTSLGLAIWGPSQVVVPSPLGDEVIRVLGVGIRPQEILMFVVAVAIMAALDWVLRRTKIGKAMRAVAHDRRIASLMGIDVTAVMIGAFFLSSALAGLSGFLIAPIASASLYVGLSIALKGFSGAIIGGLSNPRGCVLGGFSLGVLEALINLWQAQWREVVVFLIVILVLAFRPYGLLGQQTVEKV